MISGQNTSHQNLPHCSTGESFCCGGFKLRGLDPSRTDPQKKLKEIVTTLGEGHLSGGLGPGEYTFFSLDLEFSIFFDTLPSSLSCFRSRPLEGRTGGEVGATLRTSDLYVFFASGMISG